MVDSASRAGRLPLELTRARLVFWDFDGVIKESVDVKTRAFVSLFDWAGPEVARTVQAHHESHGGMSRAEKIPLYLEMAGERPTPERVAELSERFGRAVFTQVVEAPWVPGAEQYLRTNPFAQLFALVSATPEPELLQIVEALNLRQVFSQVHGAPTTKTAAVREGLNGLGIAAGDSVFVGDAKADLVAATANGVAFVLREHATNRNVFPGYAGLVLTGFPSCFPDQTQ